MFGSQALETAIGLALMFFILATAASAIAEIYASLSKKRSEDLKTALKDMFSTGELPGGLTAVTTDEVEAFVKRTTGRAESSYMSAKSFADAATELISKGQNIGVIRNRMDAMAREAKGRIGEVKAGLENWFDEVMAAAQDKYSKWASWFLFFTGLALAVALNASVINTAQALWNDSAAREAVVDAAGNAEAATGTCDEKGTAFEQAKCSVDSISTFQLPIGWGENQRDGWIGTDDNDPSDSDAPTIVWWWLTHVVGWFLTAILLMLGAPFWFDLLGRLVNLRAGGPRPNSAADDDASYSTKVTKTPPPPPDPDDLVPSDGKVVSNIAGALSPRPGLEWKDFQAMALPDRMDLFHAAAPTIFRPPPATDAQDVDWLATALNLGVPMSVVDARVARQKADAIQAEEYAAAARAAEEAAKAEEAARAETRTEDE
jgi:hypothetical protein